MSHHTSSPQLLIIFFPLLLLSLLPALPALPALPNPDPEPTRSFHPNLAAPVTIPSFPEQSALSGCPVNLPNKLFTAVNTSCKPHQGKLSRSECCPVLASWLYSSYSITALGIGISSDDVVPRTTSFDMPLLPDDSETCVDSLESRIRNKGVNLVKPNETCDVVYCFCGIRLHPLSCPQAFRVSDKGGIVKDPLVSKLETDCLRTRVDHVHNVNNGSRSRLARCSKCLHSLYSLKKSGTVRTNATGIEGRTRNMRGRDCELMGLTWLLNKNRDEYMSTVTAVMRALILSSDDSDPLSCSLSSDGLPLAVDSVEIDDQSSSVALHFSPYLYLNSLVSLIMYLSYYF